MDKNWGINLQPYLEKRVLDPLTGMITVFFLFAVIWGMVTVVRKYMIEDARVALRITLGADENGVTFTVRYVTDDTLWRGIKSTLFTGSKN